MIISFGLTMEAFKARRKTVTRRQWKSSHAAKFKAGMVADAWSQLPHVKGAKPIGKIELVKDAYLEPTSMMPDSDYEAEGFAWYDETGARSKLLKGTPFKHHSEFFSNWRREDVRLYVVRFKILEVI